MRLRTYRIIIVIIVIIIIIIVGARAAQNAVDGDVS